MSTSNRLLLVLIGMTLAGFLQPAAAQASPAPQPGITVGQGWTRLTGKRDTTTSGFFTIRNDGKATDRLASVICPVARRTIIAGNDGKAVSGVQIQPGQDLLLKPNGTHLLLQNTHFRFYAHAVIPCSAMFQNSGTMILYLQVESAGAKAFQPSRSY